MMDILHYRKRVIEVGAVAFEDIIRCCPDEILMETPLMIEYARQGDNYFNNGKVRLMVVGRAPGVFGEKTDCSVIDYKSMSVDEKVIEHCFDVHYDEDQHLSWIHSQCAKRGNRYVDSFPFFSFSKKVYLKLMNQKQDFEWYRNICHSNIFKIVSLKGGNPSDESKRIQEKYMIEIFKAEIEFYRPTHILVLDSETEQHCWISADFKKKIKVYAEECGSKICFSNRPEFRKTDDLMTTVNRDFGIK